MPLFRVRQRVALVPGETEALKIDERMFQSIQNLGMFRVCTVGLLKSLPWVSTATRYLRTIPL